MVGGGGWPSELAHLYHSYYGSSVVTYYIYITRSGLVAAALRRHVISCHMKCKCEQRSFFCVGAFQVFRGGGTVEGEPAVGSGFVLLANTAPMITSTSIMSQSVPSTNAAWLVGPEGPEAQQGL